ncbi:MAG: redoxin domain-containing protein [Streptosporangiales bacterium]|nr:redoxin domain-containing protein [Streptosporangiales bacterium]
MAIEVGDVAPDFELKDQHGTPVKLSDYRGEKSVVLVFYPLAFSRVCTGEMHSIRDELSSFQGDGVQVLALSVDSMFSLRAFSEHDNLEFPLLSDFWPHGEVAKKYGIFDENLGVATRGTFIIDKEGVVRWKVVNAIPEARDTEEYRRVLEELS